MREANYGGVGYNTNVKTEFRPVTNHGVTGIAQKNQGPGRQVYDRTYFFNLLKNKNSEIMTEINKMKQEVEDINKDNTTYLNLERKYETLIKDVRRYEGELADYNLALDKHRSDTKPDDIEALYMHIKNQNDKQRIALDQLFAEKREMENEVSSYEQQIQDINYANESKLNDLDPEQRNDYEKLKQDNSMLQNEIQDSRGQLEEVSQRLMKAEGLLKQDTLKQRAQHLREEKAQLTKRKDNLEMQTNELNLPFPEARERLMNRIKSENGEIKQLDKELTEARKMIDTYSRNIKEIEGDLKDKKDGDDMQKYEILYQKEKQINDFMTSFEEEKAEYEVDISKKQKII